MILNLENILFVIFCIILAGVATWLINLLSSAGIKGALKIGTIYAKMYPISEQSKFEMIKIYKDKLLRTQINKYYPAKIISFMVSFMAYPIVAINYSSAGNNSGG